MKKVDIDRLVSKAMIVTTVILGIMFGFGIPQSIFNGLAKLSSKMDDGRYQQ